MRILVPVKYSYDVSQMKYEIQSKAPILEAVPRSFSETDKCALEEALKLKDKYDAKVTFLTIGNKQIHSKILKDAFAMGATKGILVEAKDSDYLLSNTVAQVIVNIYRKKGPYDLILFGHGSPDTHASIIPSIVSSKLGLNVVIGVDKLEVKENIFKAICTYEDGLYTFEGRLPAIISVTSEANMPRIPTLRDILKARKLSYENLKIDDIIQEPEYIKVKKVEKFTVSRKNVRWETDSSEKLEETINNLLKVIMEG